MDYSFAGESTALLHLDEIGSGLLAVGRGACIEFYLPDHSLSTPIRVVECLEPENGLIVKINSLTSTKLHSNMHILCATTGSDCHLFVLQNPSHGVKTSKGLVISRLAVFSATARILSTHIQTVCKELLPEKKGDEKHDGTAQSLGPSKNYVALVLGLCTNVVESALIFVTARPKVTATKRVVTKQVSFHYEALPPRFCSQPALLYSMDMILANTSSSQETNTDYVPLILPPLTSKTPNSIDPAYRAVFSYLSSLIVLGGSALSDLFSWIPYGKTQFQTETNVGTSSLILYNNPTLEEIADVNKNIFHKEPLTVKLSDIDADEEEEDSDLPEISLKDHMQSLSTLVASRGYIDSLEKMGTTQDTKIVVSLLPADCIDYSTDAIDEYQNYRAVKDHPSRCMPYAINCRMFSETSTQLLKHSGAIMQIRCLATTISPQSFGKHEDSNFSLYYALTVSDDRSIGLWEFTPSTSNNDGKLIGYRWNMIAQAGCFGARPYCLTSLFPIQRLDLSNQITFDAMSDCAPNPVVSSSNSFELSLSVFCGGEDFYPKIFHFHWLPWKLKFSSQQQCLQSIPTISRLDQKNSSENIRVIPGVRVSYETHLPSLDGVALSALSIVQSSHRGKRKDHQNNQNNVENAEKCAVFVSTSSGSIVKYNLDRLETALDSTETFQRKNRSFSTRNISALAKSLTCMDMTEETISEISEFVLDERVKPVKQKLTKAVSPYLRVMTLIPLKHKTCENQNRNSLTCAWLFNPCQMVSTLVITNNLENSQEPLYDLDDMAVKLSSSAHLSTHLPKINYIPLSNRMTSTAEKYQFVEIKHIEVAILPLPNSENQPNLTWYSIDVVSNDGFIRHYIISIDEKLSVQLHLVCIDAPTRKNDQNQIVTKQHPGKLPCGSILRTFNVNSNLPMKDTKHVKVYCDVVGTVYIQSVSYIRDPVSYIPSENRSLWIPIAMLSQKQHQYAGGLMQDHDQVGHQDNPSDIQRKKVLKSEKRVFAIPSRICVTFNRKEDTMNPIVNVFIGDNKGGIHSFYFPLDLISTISSNESGSFQQLCQVSTIYVPDIITTTQDSQNGTISPLPILDIAASSSNCVFVLLKDLGISLFQWKYTLEALTLSYIQTVNTFPLPYFQGEQLISTSHCTVSGVPEILVAGFCRSLSKNIRIKQSEGQITQDRQSEDVGHFQAGNIQANISFCERSINESYFVIARFSLTSIAVLAMHQVPVGTWDRPWSFILESTDDPKAAVELGDQKVNPYTLGYISSSDLNQTEALKTLPIYDLCLLKSCSNSSPLQEFFMKGFHRRVISKMEILSLPPTSGKKTLQDSKYVVSVSDDNTVLLSKIVPNVNAERNVKEGLLPGPDQLHQLQILNNFSQPMKTLVVSKLLTRDLSFLEEDTFEKTIFVGGGRETVSILQFQRDDSASLALLSCMNSCTASARPQVSGKLWLDHEAKTAQRMDFVDVRILSMDAVAFPVELENQTETSRQSSSKHQIHLLATGNSMGVVSLSWYSSSHNLQTLWSSNYLDFPILDLKFFTGVPQENSSSLYLAAISTRGKVLIWDLSCVFLQSISNVVALKNADFPVVFERQFSDGALNSIDFSVIHVPCIDKTQSSSSKVEHIPVVMFSLGLDSGDILVAMLHLNEGRKFDLVDAAICNRHASSVRSVHFLQTSSQSQGMIRILSCGYDQAIAINTIFVALFAPLARIISEKEKIPQENEQLQECQVPGVCQTQESKKMMKMQIDTREPPYGSPVGDLTSMCLIGTTGVLVAGRGMATIDLNSIVELD